MIRLLHDLLDLCIGLWIAYTILCLAITLICWWLLVLLDALG